MRISDWSSDVCSSDLGAGPGCARPKPGRASRDDTLTIDASQGGSMNRQTAILAAGIALLALAQTHAAHAAEAAQSASEAGAGAEGTGDRKSVGEGTGVSGRVDTGERVKIQKKTKGTM